MTAKRGPRDWSRDCPRRMMAGFHVPDYDQITDFPKLRCELGIGDILARVDPGEIVKAIKAAHIQAFWFYSKCHYGNAYYPSKAGHVHSALKGRDLFGELVEACLSEGIVPLCVYEFNDLRMPKDHPDWCHKIPENPDFGKVNVADALEGASVNGPCFNGPYGEFALEQAREVLKRYPVKGYYVDFLGLFGFDKWICPYCNQKLKKILGRDFPGIKNLGHDKYVKYVQWRMAETDAYSRQLRKLIKDLRPDVVFLHNFHGFRGAADMQWFDFASRNCDYLGADLFQLWDGLAPISWKTRALAAGSHGLPGEALLDSVTCVERDLMTPKALDSYRVELWTARAVNVATCTSFIMNLDGTFDRHVFALNEKIMREHQTCEPWLQNMEPVFLIGLVRSSRSLAFRPVEPDSTFPAVLHHQAEMEGWAQVLIAAHQLWTVVDESQLQTEYLKNFKVLILPNVSCLDRPQVAALSTFVKAGGTLIATGDTTLFDGQGRKQKDFRLARVFGVHFEADSQVEHIHLDVKGSDFFSAKEPWVSNILRLTSGQLVVKAVSNARIIGTVGRRAAVNFLINIMFPTGLPGLVQHGFGKGTCWYFAGKPGLQFRCYGQTNVKRLMKAILQGAVGMTPPVRLEAPDAVEMMVHRQRGQNHLVVNLINAPWGVTRSAAGCTDLTGKRGPARMDEAESMPALDEVRLYFRNKSGRPIRKVYLVPGRVKLPWREGEGEAIVRLKSLGAHAMVVAEY